MKNRKLTLLSLVFLAVVLLCLFAQSVQLQPAPEVPAAVQNLPPYSAEVYIAVNNNEPLFTQEELQAQPFEYYSELDSLGRCGYTMACVSRELMPTEERSSISHVKPSGWQSAQYDFVDGKYLYNRSHLIGFQLTGENDNERNLITGTRHLNATGMLAFENMVADYIKETGNRVLYRVTPVYTGDNLVADGVLMEAKSVEDAGEGICFFVYVYNVQPGVVIDYATGQSCIDEAYFNKDAQDYVLNTNSKRFHKPDCTDAQSMKPANRQQVHTAREILTVRGYKPCGSCDP